MPQGEFAVSQMVHSEALSCERSYEEQTDPLLFLHYQYAHTHPECLADNAGFSQMTPRFQLCDKCVI